MKNRVYILLLGVFTLLGSADAHAQKYKERRFIRSGNELYEKGDYVESEVSYRRAIEEAAGSLEANYNLAASLYKQEQFKEAAQMYESIIADSTIENEVSSQVLYNSGNSLFKQRELEKALEAYKSSLRINPNDMEAKFNLAYTQKLLEEDKKKQEQEDQNKDDQDKKDDQQDKENQNKDDQKDQDDKEGDKDQDKKDDQQKPEDKEGEGEQNRGNISKQDAEQMLNAVQMEEDKTREKQDAKKVKTVGKSGKNW